MLVNIMKTKEVIEKYGDEAYDVLEEKGEVIYVEDETKYMKNSLL
jgi:hypothetical protein